MKVITNMEIYVHCRSKPRSDLISNCAKFYAKVLKLDNSRFRLNIHSKYKLSKNKKRYGEVVHEAAKDIILNLDSKLGVHRLLLVLAHEMVHVKQIVKGQYKGRLSKNGKLTTYWCGKAIRKDYRDQPWEIEAYAKQYKLCDMLLQTIATNMKI